MGWEMDRQVRKSAPVRHPGRAYSCAGFHRVQFAAPVPSPTNPSGIGLDFFRRAIAAPHALLEIQNVSDALDRASCPVDSIGQRLPHRQVFRGQQQLRHPRHPCRILAVDQRLQCGKPDLLILCAGRDRPEQLQPSAARSRRRAASPVFTSAFLSRAERASASIRALRQVV